MKILRYLLVIVCFFLLNELFKYVLRDFPKQVIVIGSILFPLILLAIIIMALRKNLR